MTDNVLIRRDFLKKTTQAALVVGGGLILDALVNSCAHISFESPGDIANIKWDANPAIPVPVNGCYAGWHRDISPNVLLPETCDVKSTFFDSEEEDQISFYEENYGKGPAVHSFSDRLIKGDFDDKIKAFAQGAKEFGKPFFFVPYPEANIGGRYKHVHSWAESSGKEFRKAWKYIHNVFDVEGANDYAVWGLH